MEGYITVRHKSEFLFEDRKSRFIGEAMPVEAEADAIAFIEYIRKKYPDANHHVYAYVIRDNSITRYSDDREPQGTAGMPVLDIIRKNGCTNTVIVVTRYFGGTLLGTGGLVHAYSSAALGALKAAEIINYDIYADIVIECTYSDFQKMTAAFQELGFRTADTEYSDKIVIRGSIKAAAVDMLAQKLTELSSGRAKIEKLGEKFDF